MNSQNAIEYVKADQLLLNTKGGTYDLRTCLSNSHTNNPEDLITKCAPIEPSEKWMDIWCSFLQTILVNNQELSGYVQLVVGLGAIGHVFLKAVILSEERHQARNGH